MKNIVIIGATSAIALACARRWSTQGDRFFLVARNGERLQQIAGDLKARGASHVACYELDINSIDKHFAMLSECASDLVQLDIVLVASGSLPGQTACENDAATAVHEFNTNALSVIALLTPLANILAAQQHGTLAVISSVAGDRGRPSNYLYGSAKAALSAFLEGLRARFYKTGAHVLTIKSGFVATPMTAGLSMPGPLVASADAVAREIVGAIDKKKNVLYIPGFWWAIMAIVRLIPQGLSSAFRFRESVDEAAGLLNPRHRHNSPGLKSQMRYARFFSLGTTRRCDARYTLSPTTVSIDPPLQPLHAVFYR
jgi:decaprenylphospho-beta-D-erythro-pentofuranosid-2-ulose 2-reductase